MHSPVISLLGFALLVPLVSVAVWAALGYWPRFRTRWALLRVSEVVAVALAMLLFLRRHEPQAAVANPVLPTPTIVFPGRPTTRPVHSNQLPASIMSVDGRSFLIAELPAAPATQPAKMTLKHTAPATASGALGPPYTDETNGFALRFPAGWAVRSFDDSGPWIVGATDGKDALITVGLAPPRSVVSPDAAGLAAMVHRIKAEPQASLEAQGYAKIDGHRAIWSRSLGLIAIPPKSSARMTRIEYQIPLADGRALQLRIAATPDQFDKLAGVMKQSVSAIRLLAH